MKLPQIKGHDLLTHSRMDCYQKCRRQHFYKYVLGLRKTRDSTPLRVGGMVHEMLDQLAQGDTLPDVVNWLCLTYDTDEYPMWAMENEASWHEWEIEREMIHRLVEGYINHWEAETDPELTVKQYLETEEGFQLPIRNDKGNRTPSFDFAGKTDKVCLMNDGRQVVMEHKTCGEAIDIPESDYWKRLKIDTQISGYMHAAIERGYDVETVIYDVIRKPTIKPQQIPLKDDEGFKIVHDEDGERQFLKNGKPRQAGSTKDGWVLQTEIETPEAYSERLAADIAERPGFYYQRVEIPRMGSDLEEFRAEMWDKQKDIAETMRTNRHYRNSSACIRPYRCPFLDICHNSIDAETAVPDGFERSKDLHPELSGENE